MRVHKHIEATCRAGQKQSVYPGTRTLRALNRKRLLYQSAPNLPPRARPTPAWALLTGHSVCACAYSQEQQVMSVFYTHSYNHALEVKPVIDAWRRDNEYNAQDLNTDFMTDCSGSRALDVADPDSTILLWMHNATLGDSAKSTRDTRVGFIGAIYHPGRRPAQFRLEIQRIYVLPTHRRGGVGSALLSALCSAAKHHGATSVSLGSGLRNQHQSRHFWCKLGYTLTGPHEILDTMLPIHKLTANLPAPHKAMVEQAAEPCSKLI